MNDNWQPIETAPTDGTDIIIFVPESSDRESLIGEAYYWNDTGKGGWLWAGTNEEEGCDHFRHNWPTLWQPLPLPPGSKDENQGYIDAFYALAELLDISAQERSPKEVWETQMFPLIRSALLAAGEGCTR